MLYLFLLKQWLLLDEEKKENVRISTGSDAKSPPGIESLRRYGLGLFSHRSAMRIFILAVRTCNDCTSSRQRFLIPPPLCLESFSNSLLRPPRFCQKANTVCVSACVETGNRMSHFSCTRFALNQPRCPRQVAGLCPRDHGAANRLSALRQSSCKTGSS